jgi:hypothetical protein
MLNESAVLQDFIDWKRVSVELRTLKAKESKLRDRLTSTVLQGSMEPVKYFVDGYNIKATPKTTLKIDEAVLSSVMEYLTDAEKLLVTYKPSITKANIKKVPLESPLMEAIIEKPGKSTLSVEFEVSDGD